MFIEHGCLLSLGSVMRKREHQTAPSETPKLVPCLQSGRPHDAKTGPLMTPQGGNPSVLQRLMAVPEIYGPKGRLGKK